MAFRDDFSLTVLGDEDRELLQVCSHKVPHTFLGPGLKLEAVFEAAIGFVCGDNQVLLDRSDSDGLIERPLLFVENSDIGHNEPRDL